MAKRKDPKPSTPLLLQYLAFQKKAKVVLTTKCKLESSDIEDMLNDTSLN